MLLARRAVRFVSTVQTAVLIFFPAGLAAQEATVRVRVTHDGVEIPGVRVRVDTIVRTTDRTGATILRIAAGQRTVHATRIGFAADSLTFIAGSDTTITFSLERLPESLESVVVSATRSERRVEDIPLRVEVIDAEEIAEKVAMTPGDIAMMMNETSGLRVATTSPSLGGANVRIQGLRGRYTLMLMDGLPLTGGQSGFGLLQIPPVDLARVEVIKGTASALYGSAAIGGVINLISRRPSDEPEREILLNQTTRGGTDAVFYASSPRGMSLLVSAHRQSDADVDGDHWADLPRYKRIVARPRLFLGDEKRNLLATVGVTSEDRNGGGTTPLGDQYREGLRTRRLDAGAIGRAAFGERGMASMRASVTSQKHRHRFGERVEDDSHVTAFAEASAAWTRRRVTFVGGAAFQFDSYRNDQVNAFDFTHHVPSLFSQTDVDVSRWLVLSAAGRVDWHNEFGTSINPRLSALVRAPAEWSLRISGGRGTFAPTPLTEETEATGLGALSSMLRLESERATSATVDINGPIETSAGRIELNVTAFASRIRGAVVVRPHATSDPRSTSGIEMLNAPMATRNSGGEFLLRWVVGDARLTASYAYLRATEWDPETGNDARRAVPLAPRHTAGLVGSIEREGVSRIGLEIYYTGTQSLDDNPFRDTSRPYVIFGLLAERQFATRIGRARAFVNAENIGNVRQTRFDPLVRPTPGAGGRRTTDAWTDLAGFTLNGGVRLSF